MENSKARVLMLVASGVLFGASGFGWWVHSMPRTPQGSTSPTWSAATSFPKVGATGAVSSNIGPSGAASVGEAARTGAESRAQGTALAMASSPISAPEVYLATKREDAERAARASIRQDPFSSLAGAPTSTVNTARMRNDYVPPPPDTRLIDPPNAYSVPVRELPPPPSMSAEVAAEAPRHDRLLLGDVRLVGVIDGKAIFRVNRDTASQLGLPRAFTLGKGETFANLKVDTVNTDSATVRDGTSVATKELGPVQ